MRNCHGTGKNVSSDKVERYLQMLGYRLVVVPKSAEVEPRTTMLSLRVGGSLDPSAVSKAYVLAEAASWGLDAEFARQVYETCLAGIERGIRTAGKRYPKSAERHESNAFKRLEKLAR